MYRVEVDWAPAYELLVSLKAYVSRSEHATLDMGASWAKDVRRRITPELAVELRSTRVLDGSRNVDLLIWQCEGERSPASFIRWLAGLTAGELYERLSPLARNRRELPVDLAAFRDRYVHLLTAWDEQYFQHIAPAILHGLREDADRRRSLLACTTPDAMVEQATSGIHLVAEPAPALVLLVPQFHYRPWNIYAFFRDMTSYQYPADVLPAAPGEPPLAMLRTARALADESRLRILHLLAGGECSFTEVVRATGLAKSTVHHHMVLLRAAGLVRVHDAGEKTATYSLRGEAVGELEERLRSYLKGEKR